MIKAKMVKNVNDECYGEKFEQIEDCPSCWIRTSCGATYKSKKKKAMMAGKKKEPREKTYKKTDKHRDW
ncbi:hypothetical protein H6503_05740 [Candidatus Woesearchaeota archaeon]|nr:hypothetical protein [Candidatus Woesearchaeota archaeon]